MIYIPSRTLTHYLFQDFDQRRFSLSKGLVSWNPNLVGPGFVKGGAWTKQCPEMDGEYVCSFRVWGMTYSIPDL